MKTAIDKIKTIGVSPIGQFCFILAVLYLVLSGCTTDNGLTKSLDKIQVLPEEARESLRHPLRTSVIATCETLAGEGFLVERIEMQRDYGAVVAVRQKTTVKCRFNALTEDLTRIRVNVHHANLISDAETKPDRIFSKVENALQTRRFMPLDDLTRNMTPVYVRPDDKSPVVAYMAAGAEVTVHTDYEDDAWSRLELVTGGFGYIESRNMKPVPFSR